MKGYTTMSFQQTSKEFAMKCGWVDVNHNLPNNTFVFVHGNKQNTGTRNHMQNFPAYKKL